MPVLPSGRRVEFSLDRFNAMIDMLPSEQARELVDALHAPDDLLHVLDIVGFDAAGRPHLTQCLAQNWRLLALEWSPADRVAFGDYLRSAPALAVRTQAIVGVRSLLARRLAADCLAGAQRQLA